MKFKRYITLLIGTGAALLLGACGSSSSSSSGSGSQTPTFGSTEYRVAVSESSTITATDAVSYSLGSGGATVATIGETDGVVTGVAPGVDTIIATASDGSTASVTLVVNNRPTALAGYHSFVSGYAVASTTGDSRYAETIEGYPIYSNAVDGFSISYSGNDSNFIAERLAVGVQVTHDTTLSTSAAASLSFISPVEHDFSSATHLVIQMGEGTSSDTESHSIFSLSIYGNRVGCEIDVTIEDDSRIGSANANAAGLKTYQIELATMTCVGTLSDMLGGVNQIDVQLEGGKDALASNSTGSHTLLTVGNIGFYGAIADTPNTNSMQLFAAGYIQDNSEGRFVGTNANSGVYQFGSSDVGDGFFYVNTAGAISERQSMGAQLRVTGGATASTEFGLTIQAPNAGRVAISSDSALLIQMGSGSGDLTANSHGIYTVRLLGGIQSPGDYSWGNDCEVEVDVSDTRPLPDTSGRNPYGLKVFSLPISDFTTCRTGSMDDLVSNGVSEVVVSVVGGTDAEASAAADSYTLIAIGWIAFTE